MQSCGRCRARAVRRCIRCLAHFCSQTCLAASYADGSHVGCSAEQRATALLATRTVVSDASMLALLGEAQACVNLGHPKAARQLIDAGLVVTEVWAGAASPHHGRFCLLASEMSMQNHDPAAGKRYAERALASYALAAPLREACVGRALVCLASAELVQWNLVEAARAYQHAARIVSADVDFLAQRALLAAMLHSARGAFAKSVAAALEAAELFAASGALDSDEEAEALYLAGRCLVHLGRREEAVGVLERALAFQLAFTAVERPQVGMIREALGAARGKGG